jgi:hypothetical protein
MVPIIHFIEREGKRVYRIWSHHCESYLTNEMSLDEVRSWQLQQDLVEATSKIYHPDPDFLDMGANGWWSDEAKYVGIVEQLLETGPCDFQEEHDGSLRYALVARMAIEAYKAYVQNGGDPSQLPIMSFEADRITVSMKAEDDVVDSF